MYTDPAPNAGQPQQAAAEAPAGAVQMVRQNPNLVADFDAKYGAGAAARALGAPAAPNSPQGAAPSQTPTKFAIKPKTGERLGLVNGQWVPISGSDAAAGNAPPRIGETRDGYSFRGDDPLSQARDAIARGADPAAVRRRVQQNGVDPAGLSKP